MPAVLVMLCTARRIRRASATAPRDPLCKVPRNAPPAALRSAAHYWNVTGKDWVLFEVFFSPATGATVALTVYLPAGGAELSVT
jgi:hypothetical protein